MTNPHNPLSKRILVVSIASSCPRSSRCAGSEAKAYGDSERMNELFGEFAIASMLPIALKIGADADFRAPMAIAIIGGLTTSIKTRRFHAARKVDLQLA